MNQLKWSAIAIGILSLFIASDARAQVPFFNPGVAIFDPEISILNTGTVTDATATVSADRKYVTIGARFSQSDLIALRSFAFESGTAANGTGDNGFVGVGARGQVVANAAHNGDKEAELPPQTQTILTRPGMTLISAPRATSVKVAPTATPSATNSSERK